jgi:hypothetical protein
LVPTYIYEVLHDGKPTGETFEVFQKMADAPLTRDDKGRECRKMITAPRMSHMRDLAGMATTSAYYWCHPSEVSEYQQGIAKHGGDPNVVTKEGDFTFQTAAQKKRTSKAIDRFQREYRDKHAKSA